MVKPLGGLNILPFAYIFSSLTAAWVILGRKLFDLRPFAHGMIFENMTDGFIVLNKQLEILDANPPHCACWTFYRITWVNSGIRRL